MLKVPTMVECKHCGREVSIEGVKGGAYTGSVYLNEEGTGYVSNVYCSKNCYRDRMVECCVCGKKLRFGEKFTSESGSFAQPRTFKWVHYENVWCSQECHEITEKRKRRKNLESKIVGGLVIFMLYCFSAVGMIFAFWTYYPNPVIPLLWVVPIYGAIAGIAYLLIMRDSDGTAACYGVWTLFFGLPYAVPSIVGGMALAIILAVSGVLAWVT